VKLVLAFREKQIGQWDKGGRQSVQSYRTNKGRGEWAHDNSSKIEQGLSSCQDTNHLRKEGSCSNASSGSAGLQDEVMLLVWAGHMVSEGKMGKFALLYLTDDLEDGIESDF
jgi:hypothetical protein